MARLICIPFFIATVLSCSPNCGRQANNAVANERANAVKEAFQFSMNAYFVCMQQDSIVPLLIRQQYAFPNDDLHPVNNTFGNSRYDAFSSSAVDEPLLT